MVLVLRYSFDKITSLFPMCGSQRKRMILLFAGPSFLYHLFALKGEGGLLPFTTVVSAFLFSRKCCHIVISEQFLLMRMMMSNIWCPASAQRANFCAGREIDGTVAAPAVNTLKISYTREYWARYPTSVNASHNILHQWIFLRIAFICEYNSKSQFLYRGS